MQKLITLGWLVVFLVSCQPTTPPGTATALPSPTARPSPTPPPTATSAPRPLQAPPPGAVPPGEDPLHWVAADLDGDGVDELAVRTCDGLCNDWASGGRGHLRILEPSQEGYALQAELDVSPGFTFQPSVEVMQVRPNGGLAIVEQAPCGAHSTCLALYTWDGTAYRVLSFASSAMGIVVNGDGTVLVGQRDAFTDPLVNSWTEVYRWDGSGYVLKEVTFEGQPYQGPAGAVRAYYHAVNVCLSGGDVRAAYAYLSRDFQARHPFDDFQAGFANTVRVDVVDLVLVEESADRAAVEVAIVAVDQAGEGTEETTYDLTWQVIREEGAWRLDQAEG
jgi:hypothetical protein